MEQQKPNLFKFVLIIILALAVTPHAQANDALTNPKDAEAYNKRGIHCFMNGGFDGAIADYTQAILLNPKHDGYYYNRGLAYSEKGDYDKAIADFAQAIQINPKYDAAYHNRGKSYAQKGDYDKAISDFQKAISISPDDVMSQKFLEVVRNLKNKK